MNSIGTYEICTWPVSKGKCLAFTFILHLNLGKNRASAFDWAALRAFGLWEGTGTMFSAAEETQSHRENINSLMESQLGCFYLSSSTLFPVQQKKTFHSQVSTEQFTFEVPCLHLRV